MGRRVVERRIVALSLLALVVGVPAPGGAGPMEDGYVVGYATAVLERQLGMAGSKVRVKDGVLTVEVAGVPASAREKIVVALGGLAGVTRVEVVEAAGSAALASPPAPRAAPAAAPAPTGPAVEAEVPRRGMELWPKGHLFAPLIADPRWPHSSVVSQRFLGDPQLGDVVAVSLGETFPVVRAPAPGSGQWELGLQAGIFSIFDLDTPSSDRVNTDYIVGMPIAYRAGNFSGLARVYHQSSHLGDEFLLRNRIDRINLSFEAADLRLPYELTEWLRLYVGGGYMFRREPADLEPWSTQIGIELKSSRTVLAGALRPVAALDVQNREQNDWNTDLSLRVGVQLENLAIFNRTLQLLLEYFNGHSPNGQFYRERIESLGLGLHLYLF